MPSTQFVAWRFIQENKASGPPECVYKQVLPLLGMNSSYVIERVPGNIEYIHHHHHHHHQLFKHGSPFSKAGLQGAMHLKYYKNFKRANNNESRQGKRTSSCATILCPTLPYPSLHYPTLPYLTLPYHVNAKLFVTNLQINFKTLGALYLLYVPPGTPVC